MIKKSVFEDDLIIGMQHELQPFEKKAGMQNLSKAADLLNAAVEIFEEAGMTARADQVLRILGKIAIAHANVRTMPSLKALMDAGVTPQDLKNVRDPVSRARVNTAMRVLGYSDKEIHHFLGDKFMSDDEAADILNPERPYQNLVNWIQNPTTPVDPKNPQVGEEISFQSIAKHKPKNPTKVSDSYKMNPLEMAMADDLLDLDINDAETELLEESPEDKTFEDSD